MEAEDSTGIPFLASQQRTQHLTPIVSYRSRSLWRGTVIDIFVQSSAKKALIIG